MRRCLPSSLLHLPFLPIVLAAALALLVAACSGGEAAAPNATGLQGRLTLTGSSTCAPLVSEIAKRFEKKNPGVRIDVQTGGSSRGIADAASGLADIGMASRGLKAGEADDLVAHVIAQDGISVIVHGDNPIVSLSNAQIRSIYLGEITRWSEVGGPDTEITVVNKAAGRATLEVFVEYFDLDEKNIEADVVIGDNEQGVKTVAGNPDAIGYVSIGTAEYNHGEGVPIKLLPAGGIAATSENVSEGRFPIGRPLNLITRGPAEGVARAFVEYAQSSSVHDLVRDLYFVPAQKVAMR